MFFFVRWVLGFGKGLVATRDDAPTEPPATRQSTRTSTSTLKGTSTCSRHSLHVTITSAPHVQDVLAAATCIRTTSLPPVFVLKHTAVDLEVLDAVSSNSTPNTHSDAQNIPLQHKERVYAAETQRLDARSCSALDDTLKEQVWGDGNDANVKILQKPTDAAECTAIIMDLETMNLLDALYSEPGAVVWEPDVPGAPYIALTPADESWDDCEDRYSNQLRVQWVGPYLHVPFSIPAFSPYGPTEPLSEEQETPVPVFSPSRFADSVRITLEQAPYQALFVQRHAYKAVAYVAALVGESIRAFYDDPAALRRLDALAPCVWTDPAAPLLKAYRQHLMVTILESENPFSVPHIVVTAALPNMPLDAEAAVVPQQDTSLLYVPMWSYLADLLAEQEEAKAEEEEDEWWRDDLEEGVVMEARYCVAVPVLSESEDEADEARTPSPPSWPMHAFPCATIRNSTRLEDVFEEDEDAEADIPSVTEARVRKPWLDEDCKEDSESHSVNATFSPRFNFNSTLSPIDEVSLETAYRPLPASYRPLWTSGASSDDASSMLSVYTDALEEQPTSEADQSEDECRGYRRAHTLGRPTCNIFVNAEDSDASSVASPPPARPRALPFAFPPEAPSRGKANIPAGKVDWFDLPDDDLGEVASWDT
ncbi:hypothetical protein C8R45DRAFT_957196 [Mycena sanguinolenta]|nr:hypothetical protein C8R45DRAFT_957196 [Mycena sanguinolenta]